MFAVKIFNIPEATQLHYAGQPVFVRQQAYGRSESSGRNEWQADKMDTNNDKHSWKLNTYPTLM
jgi:hypothetical protein